MTSTLQQFSVTLALAPQELSRENSFFVYVSMANELGCHDTLAKNEFSSESSCGASASVTENCCKLMPVDEPWLICIKARLRIIQLDRIVQIIQR